jgi:hypothetical protein
MAWAMRAREARNPPLKKKKKKQQPLNGFFDPGCFISRPQAPSDLTQIKPVESVENIAHST